MGDQREGGTFGTGSGSYQRDQRDGGSFNNNGDFGGNFAFFHQRPRIFVSSTNPYSYQYWTPGINMRGRLFQTFLRFLSFSVVCVAIFLIFFYYGTAYRTLGFREERLMRGITPYLVKSFVMFSDGLPPPGMNVTLLTFPKKPPLSDSIFFEQAFSLVSVRGFGYESWKFWLNEGSRIEVSHKMSSTSELLVVVLIGRSSLNEWKQSPDSYNGYKYQREISGLGSFDLPAVTEGEYFIVFANYDSKPVLLTSLDFAVTSATFSKSFPESSCSIPESIQCPVDLPWLSSRVALIVTPTNSTSTRLWTVKFSFHPRWRVYLGIIWATWVLTYFSGRLHSWLRS